MKKNLLSIIILALLVVNLIMTGIMMFSVVNQANKTAKIVGQIASILDIELNAGNNGSDVDTVITLEDTDVYVIPDSMTIPLALGEDGKSHYLVVTVSLSLNKKHADYSTYGSKESMDENVSLIMSEINTVVGSYTLESARANMDLMREEILEHLQRLYNSDFIFNVNFSETLWS